MSSAQSWLVGWLVERVTVPKGRNLDDAICREREGSVVEGTKEKKERKKEP